MPDREDYKMYFAHRYIRSLLLTASLAAPISMVAAALPQEASVQVRVYDSEHKDYHNWDAQEDRAYRGYLTEQHKTYRKYDKQNHKTQDSYWNWRHEHPDHN
jgi:hypothetical protein